MKVLFPMKDVLALVEWNKANTQVPSYDELFNPEYYPGGVLAEVDGWPDRSQMLTEKLLRALHLVKDRGLYLMAGTAEPMPAKEGSNDKVHVVYADGCNPHRDKDYYKNSCLAFGGDDGVARVPVDWVSLVRKRDPKSEHFELDITPQKVALVLPPAPRQSADRDGLSLS